MASSMAHGSSQTGDQTQATEVKTPNPSSDNH